MSIKPLENTSKLGSAQKEVGSRSREEDAQLLKYLERLLELAERREGEASDDVKDVFERAAKGAGLQRASASNGPSPGCGGGSEPEVAAIGSGPTGACRHEGSLDAWSRGPLSATPTTEGWDEAHSANDPAGARTPRVGASATGDLSDLPPLSDNPSPGELKRWVESTYDQFPQFKEIYEGRLGMTRAQALAFHYADMSRESGADGRWQVNLETGQGSAGHAWGPFQAAVTNFRGAGYDGVILNATGLPTPGMEDFKNPAVSAFAGMKRLAEGVIKAEEVLGPGQPPEQYLLGSLAHHNTGHAEAARDAEWRRFYGHETLRLMSGYLAGHMDDQQAFVTGQALG